MADHKHAYLILAHKNDVCFRTLLQLLDDSRNDIFIHMDKKCPDYDPSSTEKSIHYSRVYHIERTSVTWGGSSMIWAELSLLKKATSIQSYQFYHLLSGQDLPIKSQDHIHLFFDNNPGKEFVRYYNPTFSHEDRVRYYHLFQDQLGRRYTNKYNRRFLRLQERIGIKRNKTIPFYKGTQWFSITDNFARYIVEKETTIRRLFRYTFCCDEVFLQTMLMMSPYKDNRYWLPMDNNMHAIMRLIDWERGDPYVFRIDDLDELKSTDLLFCRKFDSQIDGDIIQSVCKLCGK